MVSLQDVLCYVNVIAVGFHTSLAIIGKNEFDGYKLYKLQPTSPITLDRILSEIPRDINDLDILKRSRYYGDTTDILISPEKADHLVNMAKKYNVPINITHSNFRDVLEMSEHETRRAGKNPYDPFRYRSYNEIKDFIFNISKTNSKCVKVVKIGKSYEKRDVYMVKISKDPSKGNPVILVDALIHAREWVSGAMALYLIQQMAENCAKNSSLNKVDWYIIPIVNPDGYEYTRKNKENRYWRKTRSRLQKSKCRGVDGNRNYGWHFGESGVSSNKCEEDYPGSRGFTEKETRNVAAIMYQFKSAIKLYISLHSYGEYLVYPYGYTGEYLPKEWKKLESLAKKVNYGIVQAGGKAFNVTSAGKWYPAAGGSDDYAYGSMNIPYAYTMELTNNYGFVFPEEGLQDYLEKIYNGFKVLPQEIVREFPETTISLSIIQ